MTKQSPSSASVWTTLITNGKYLPGVLTLDFSLKRVRSRYSLVALYTESLSAKDLSELAKRNITTFKINSIRPSQTSPSYTNDPRFVDCWSKLQSFSLYQYDKVVQLDSDMVVLQNMDELFDIELNNQDRVFAASHACLCNPYQKAHYPQDWVPENCAFTDYHAKLPEPFKYHHDHEVMGPHPTNTSLGLCNGGLLVIKPDEVLYSKIIHKLENDVLTYTFPDQDLLSDVFDSRWIGISYVYNYLKTLKNIHTDLDFAKVKNIHYIVTPKPWEVSPKEFKDETDTFKHWWSINEERLEFELENGIV